MKIMGLGETLLPQDAKEALKGAHIVGLSLYGLLAFAVVLIIGGLRINDKAFEAGVRSQQPLIAEIRSNSERMLQLYMETKKSDITTDFKKSLEGLAKK